MAESADVQAHWTRPGVLARIDAALTELGHDPQNLNAEILATLEHLHSGGLATTRDQAKRVAITEDSRVLDVGCGIGGPARYLAHTYGCRVDGIDLTPELIETARVLTKRCKLATASSYGSAMRSICPIPSRPSTWFGAKTSA
jgi:MPBQ/MSBQ methyltransferase